MAGHGDLADIVEQSSETKAVHAFRVKAELLADHPGVAGNSFAMSPGVEVLDFERSQEAREGVRFGRLHLTTAERGQGGNHRACGGKRRRQGSGRNGQQP